MFWNKKKKDEKQKIKDQKSAAIDEELRIATDIIRRFSKWNGDDRRESSDSYEGLERRHSNA